MRGKEAGRLRRGQRQGITPAYAGKRSWPTSTRTAARDHPRVCGEKAFVAVCCHLVKGSPPRMRGKVKEFACKDGSPRITPAYAGKSAAKVGGWLASKDHPRVCGEKYCCTAIASRRSGSPPRMRGKGARICKDLERMGITPACAGKSSCRFSRMCSNRDHPRVCGEKWQFRAATATSLGSPPRVRGKAKYLGTRRPGPRITPACAGKRLNQTFSPSRYGDHPRVCGEKRANQMSKVYSRGSPPRVRGKGEKLHRTEPGRRITPACAGKSPSCVALLLPVRDHPRVCGEKYADHETMFLERGSPPRVRGKELER